MSYDSKSYRGTLERGLSPGRDVNVLASHDTTDNFVNLIRSLRPKDRPEPGGFSRTMPQGKRDIIVTLLTEEERQWLGRDGAQLGLASAFAIARQRRFLWKKDLAPGIYTVTKTVYADEDSDHGELQTHVQENVHSIVRLGRPVDTVSTRLANEEEVVQAIDTLFLNAMAVTVDYLAGSSPDNPAIPVSAATPWT